MTLPRIAFLGPGAIAAEHARAFRQLGCPLAAVMGPDAEAAAQFAKRHAVARSTDTVADIVDADDVDAVVVASPSGEHAGQALAALRGGKHVLCEIPLGLSLAEVTAAAEAAGDRIAMACHTQRYLPVVSALRARVVAGEFEPISMSITSAIYRRSNVGWTGERRDWADDIIWHHTTHAVDTSLWLLDDGIESVQALAGPADRETGRPLDLALALRTRTGRLATIAMSYNAIRPVSEVSVFGRSETARISNWQPSHAAASEPNDLLGKAAFAQAQAFLSAIAQRPGSWPSFRDVLPTYRVIQQVYDQIRQESSPA
ncbi:Gfo/Idh/MocA family protein [Actinacidiphila oryziradicis]|uniref:Gfo/Idh/MocA family oxidoreductase n=1 Tax=Actinacidiphila oryziradicis TaxID=2571141 RepID=A0A4U0RZJ3_9ACTN|nr:Gfo/Idh/MocA family oxidoreductase [Actinacidiphila oryziradicis]TKA01178.1 Gfo/Idh/MocA family oxidoreductase [Actinacidiphila oryziradicis]